MISLPGGISSSFFVFTVLKREHASFSLVTVAGSLVSSIGASVTTSSFLAVSNCKDQNKDNVKKNFLESSCFTKNKDMLYIQYVYLQGDFLFKLIEHEKQLTPVFIYVSQFPMVFENEAKILCL